jgi:hypothetical protein
MTILYVTVLPVDLKSIPRDCPGNTTQLIMTGNNLLKMFHWNADNGLLLMFNSLNKSNLVNGVCPVQLSTLRYCSLGKWINASLSNKCRLFPGTKSVFKHEKCKNMCCLTVHMANMLYLSLFVTLFVVW